MTGVATEVHAPGDRTVTLQYEQHDARWYLTNITDSAGISSSFTYAYNDIAFPYWFIDSMTTPYGTTQFEYLGSSSLDISGDVATIYGRTLLITQPDGSQHLFLQADTEFGATPPVPISFDPGVIPTGLPLSTLDTNRQDRNTFYWGPVQMAAIGNHDVDNWGTNQFKLARVRHWLKENDLWDTGHDHISPTLSWEQLASPDGTTEGQVTWYDYVGKTNSSFIGTNRMPSVVARVMPDGTTWYEYYQRNSLENPTNIIEKWVNGGSPFYRTNKYLYAANGIDLLAHTNAAEIPQSSNVFNAYHQVVTNYDALNQRTTYIYDATTHLLTSISRPSDLITTNIYDGNNRLQETTDLPINRTRTYTWESGNIKTLTDERGMTVTNYWDALNRLTGQKYPDGTTTTNLYVRGSTKLLDVTATKDRMDHWTYFDYDPLRRKIAETNANNVVTRYGYCICGAIATVTNAWGTAIEQVTTFNYDYQGRLLTTVYADGYSVTNWYDALGKKTATGDGWGLNWFGYDYDNLGLLTSVTNGLGVEERRVVYDVLDQPTYVTDANGVMVTNTYDNLNRLLTRGYPDGGVERFGYSARGLTAYTNQLGYVTRYVYDETGRKLFGTNANLE